MMDDDISTNVINSSREIFGANAGSMMNLGYHGLGGAKDIVTGNAVAGASRIVNSVRKEFKPFKEVVAFLQHGQTNKPPIQFDEALASQDASYVGEYISACLAQKGLTMPKLPASLMVSRELHTIALEHAKQFTSQYGSPQDAKLMKSQEYQKAITENIPSESNENLLKVVNKNVASSRKANIAHNLDIIETSGKSAPGVKIERGLKGTK